MSESDDGENRDSDEVEEDPEHYLPSLTQQKKDNSDLMKAGNEASRDLRKKKLWILRKQLTKFTDLYLDDMSYLVDGSQHSVTLDICFDENQQLDTVECIKSIRCSEH